MNKKTLMKRLFLLVLGGMAVLCRLQAQCSNGYPYTQVPFTAVKITPNTFWGDRIQAAREVTVPLAFSKCESEHRYKNFEMAAYTLQHPGHAALQTPEWDVTRLMGFSFDDTDVYKTIEGASYLLQTYPDAKLEAYIDSVLVLVAAAQEPDGYLNTARTMNPWHPHAWMGPERWSQVEELSHEFYNLGHMVEAAVAHYQATGKRNFLDIAIRYADCICEAIGDGDAQVARVPGHQIAEMALCKLYLATGKKQYLDMAKDFLDRRGTEPNALVDDHRRANWPDIFHTGGSFDPAYSQCDRPVRMQKKAEGHAVRACYMYAAMADVARECGDEDLKRACEILYEDIVNAQMYITGGVGSSGVLERFTVDYDLPNDRNYSESCASIALAMFCRRMAPGRRFRI